MLEVIWNNLSSFKMFSGLSIGNLIERNGFVLETPYKINGDVYSDQLQVKFDLHYFSRFYRMFTVFKLQFCSSTLTQIQPRPLPKHLVPSILFSVLTEFHFVGLTAFLDLVGSKTTPINRRLFILWSM